MTSLMTGLTTSMRKERKSAYGVFPLTTLVKERNSSFKIRTANLPSDGNFCSARMSFSTCLSKDSAVSAENVRRNELRISFIVSFAGSIDFTEITQEDILSTCLTTRGHLWLLRKSRKTSGLYTQQTLKNSNSAVKRN